MNGHYGLLGYSPADSHSSRNISGSEEGPLGIYEGRSQFLFVTRPRRSTRPNTAAVFPAFSDASRRERASRPLVQMLELKGAYATLGWRGTSDVNACRFAKLIFRAFIVSLDRPDCNSGMEFF